MTAKNPLGPQRCQCFLPGTTLLLGFSAGLQPGRAASGDQPELRSNACTGYRHLYSPTATANGVFKQMRSALGVYDRYQAEAKRTNGEGNELLRSEQPIRPDRHSHRHTVTGRKQVKKTVKVTVRDGSGHVVSKQESVLIRSSDTIPETDCVKYICD